MSEEAGEKLTEVKASLEIVFNSIRTLKSEVLYVNQKLSNLDSTIQAFEEYSSKFYETEKILEELKTTIQELNPLSQEIHEIKQNMSGLQQSLNDQTTKQESLLNPINEAITSVQSKLSTVDQDLSKLTALEEEIVRVNNTFQELKESQESKLTEIQTNYRNISPSLDALKSNLEKNNESLQKLEEGFIEYKTTTEEKLNQVMDDSFRKTIDEIESKFDGLNTRVTNVETNFEGTNTKISNFSSKLEEVIISTTGFLNRIQNLEEKAGISTGELIGTGFDNLGMLQQLVTDLLGREKADQHISKEVGKDPVMVIRGLKGIIRDVSCIDESNSLNTSEIMLNYSETAEGKADRRTLIVNFNKDIQRVLEIGQSVLMDIGQKRMQTRNIIEEIRNLARQWTSEDDLKGELGVFMALDLLETLEKEF
ncbi:MAG: hypothetical protein JSW11_00145 [Candidatus Heimdallarchaeota archaeon]|nr:MAG: hypothetical protein JSW11_00145 [Candidatus Heimdallarchaeota archaeon]